ncbi:MAG: radical SAM protein [Pseudomonadota bacterium]
MVSSDGLSPLGRLLQRLFGINAGKSEGIDAPTRVLNARRWRLLQVESALSCNLRCVMCPWKDFRAHTRNSAIMAPEVWAALRPHLPEVESVDFTGGGEPLLQPLLAQWVEEGKSAGCETGILSNGLLLNAKTAETLISAGLDWLCVSIDGADRETYERIRQGSDFDRVCENVARISGLRRGNVPKTMINFVIMGANVHQLEAMAELAARLGVDRVNFKQCEVIRGEHGKGHGLFDARETGPVKKLTKSLLRARRVAKRLGVSTTASPFTPSECAVCEQDPRGSMFVRYDGIVAPCINCANGGPTTFLGRDTTMPTVHYGRVTDTDLPELWESESCRFFRERFEQRCKEYENTFLESLVSDSSHSPARLHEAAVGRMPSAPPSCHVCHYLYGV